MHVLTVDFKAPDAPEKLSRSLEETGFAILKNHPINWDDIEEVYREWFAFFNSPAKQDYFYDPTGVQEGYVPMEIAEKAKGAAVKDIKEFYQLYFPWGRYPSMLSPKTRELFYELFGLGKQLLTWIENYMPREVHQHLTQDLPSMLSMERTQFRILHYPGLTGNEEAGAIRAAAHEDINLITLLPAASEPGLQVMDVKGNWHDVDVDPETLIINIGDMLQEASRHFYKSTTHRVVNPKDADMTKARLSMPLFMHPKADVVLSERYTADSYLKERLRELGVLK